MEITREMLVTPKPIPPDYDWRKEPWVNDTNIRALSYYIAQHVLTAMAADGDDPADEQDERCFALLHPELTERVWKSSMAEDVIHYREACAAAMGIDRLITRWIQATGSVDAEGLVPRRQHNMN